MEGRNSLKPWFEPHGRYMEAEPDSTQDPSLTSTEYPSLFTDEDDWQLTSAYWPSDIPDGNNFDAYENGYVDGQSYVEDESQPWNCTYQQQNPQLVAENTLEHDDTRHNRVHLQGIAPAMQQLDDFSSAVQFGQHTRPITPFPQKDWFVDDELHFAQPKDPKLEEICGQLADVEAVQNPSLDEWPPTSDKPLPFLTKPPIAASKVIGQADCQLGRNLCAIFRDTDGQPRTRYWLRVMRGRGSAYLPNVGYPACDTEIPPYLTLAEICQNHPRHVWGTGLRMFRAEGWTGDKVYEQLPQDFKDSRAVQRKHNYIQQGFTRELDRMRKEYGIQKPIQTRKPAQTRKRGHDEIDLNEALDDVYARPAQRVRLGHDVNIAPLNTLVSNRRMNVSHKPKRVKYTMLPELRIHTDVAAKEISSIDERLTAEYLKQEPMLFDIMRAVNPELCFESEDEQVERLHLGREKIFDKCGISIVDANLSDVIAFSEALERIVKGPAAERGSKLQQGQASILDWNLV